MTANPVLNTKSPPHSRGMANLLPDSASISDSVTDERQMNTKKETKQRTNPVDKAERDRVGRRFPRKNFDTTGDIKGVFTKLNFVL